MNRTNRHNQTLGGAGAIGVPGPGAFLRGPVVVDVSSVRMRSEQAEATPAAIGPRALTIVSSSLTEAARARRCVLGALGLDGRHRAGFGPLAVADGWRSAERVIGGLEPGALVLCALRDVREWVAREGVRRVRRGDASGLPERAAREVVRAHEFHALGIGSARPVCGEELVRHLAMRWVLCAGACERIRRALGEDRCRVLPLEGLAIGSGITDLTGGAGADPRPVPVERQVWRSVLDERAVSILRSMTGELLIELGIEAGKPTGRGA